MRNKPATRTAARSHVALVALVSSVFAFSFSAGCGSPPDQISATTQSLTLHAQTRRLRVATWNTYSLPDNVPLGGGGPPLGPDVHGEAVAAAILRRESDIDVIALNEVFNEAVRGILVARLSSIYPYYVSKIDDAATAAQDSGLAIFSKYPLGSLGLGPDLDPPHVALSPNVTNSVFYSGNISSFCKGAHATSPGGPGPCRWMTAFGWGFFLDSAGDDWWAHKGVGLVRIQGPGRPLDLAFSHTQADYPTASYPAVRTSQFDTIKRLIMNRGTSRTTHGDVDSLIVGDLNVEGLGSSFGASVAFPNAAMLASEYGQKLWGNFGGLPYYDVWRTTSPKDDGATHRGLQVARFDYMLLNGAGYYDSVIPWSPTAPQFSNASVDHTCPQYIRRAFEDGPSDHLGLILDLGPRSAACRPDMAARPELDSQWPTRKTAIVPGVLPEPGSVFWYRVDEPGTYSLGFAEGTDPSLSFEVYPANDLSQTLAAKQGRHSVDGCDGAGVGVPCNFDVSTFFSGEQGFYVRVFDPSGLRSGSYSLLVKKHDCSALTWACHLKAGAAPLNPLPPHGNGTPPVWLMPKGIDHGRKDKASEGRAPVRA